MLQTAVLVQVLHVEGLGEILPQEVRGARLQRLAVAHHGFDGIGHVRAGEFFGVGLRARNHRNRRFVHGEIGVDVQHLHGFSTASSRVAWAVWPSCQ